jgi:hypothetical protein
MWLFLCFSWKSQVTNRIIWKSLRTNITQTGEQIWIWSRMEMITDRISCTPLSVAWPSSGSATKNFTQILQAIWNYGWKNFTPLSKTLLSLSPFRGFSSRQSSVKNSCTEFHKNPTKSLVAGYTSQTEEGSFPQKSFYLFRKQRL